MDATQLLGLIPFLFEGKRIPPTKTRPLRQGSKKALLDEDAQAADLVPSGPVPDESKSSGAAPLLPHLGTEE